MKFAHSFAALCLALPFALATPVNFQNGVHNPPAQGGNNANKGNGATASAASATAASTAASSSSTESVQDAQSSLTLLNSVIATGFANDGQDVPAAGQVASLTSTNNFINFCATVNKPITNGQQITSGSCNPAPMGVIASSANMPSSKFVFPTNGATIAPNQNFTVQMAIARLTTGFFVNADENFFSAPQQVDGSGNIQGHSHIVIEQLSSAAQTTPTDPTKFAFFKGLNDPAQNGVLSAVVAGGLPAGSYRLASINTAANHQPALVAIAQHGSLDDQIYFTVADTESGAATSAAAGAKATAANGNNGNAGKFGNGAKQGRRAL